MVMHPTPQVPPPTPTPTPPGPPYQPLQLDPTTFQPTLKPDYTPLVGTLGAGVSSLPFTAAKQTGEPTPTAAEETPEEKMGFDAWLVESGMTDAFYGGSTKIKEDIYNNYIGYLTGGMGDLAEGAGGAASIFSPQEERLMADLQNAVEVGSMSDEQAWKKIESYWSEENLRSRRSEEAGRRGETLLAGAFPGKTFPGTGPGGIGAKLAEKCGGPNLMPALQGIPMEQAQGIFGQAQQGMGLPPQLPPIQPPQPQMMNWGALGQALPSFGGGGRNRYVDALLQGGQAQGPQL